MLVSFQEGALRDALWGGHIWVFLPVNALNPLMTKSLLRKIYVSGSAWAGGDEAYPGGSGSGGIGRPQSRVPSYSGISHTQVTAHEDQTVQLSAAVSAPQCKIAGAVYRIAVSTSRPQTMPPTMGMGVGAGDFRARSGSQGMQGTETSDAVGGGVGEKGGKGEKGGEGEGGDPDFVVISWIYDIVRKRHHQ
ncbi:hypothetical protein B484DRAFT_447805 [Ochromonadaceae sp. CCMP2298]|nr:hypothetical protein B484DRAFT_447805 [Ochromonadaceae sp. CCMP2298]